MRALLLSFVSLAVAQFDIAAVIETEANNACTCFGKEECFDNYADDVCATDDTDESSNMCATS